jgi:hypothetical protein
VGRFPRRNQRITAGRERDGSTSRPISVLPHYLAAQAVTPGFAPMSAEQHASMVTVGGHVSDWLAGKPRLADAQPSLSTI